MASTLHVQPAPAAKARKSDEYGNFLDAPAPVKKEAASSAGIEFLVLKIACGVFLGNLVTGLLAALIYSGMTGH